MRLFPLELSLLPVTTTRWWKIRYGNGSVYLRWLTRITKIKRKTIQKKILVRNHNYYITIYWSAELFFALPTYSCKHIFLKSWNEAPELNNYSPQLIKLFCWCFLVTRLNYKNTILYKNNSYGGIWQTTMVY